MTTDSELLRQYAHEGDEEAFAEVVRRQADLVYSAALRVTGNTALAQDVTQAVFTKLARHAAQLSRYDTLVGWLHTTARHEAINTIRGESRRRVREQEAFIMQNDSSAPEANWEQLGPVLDEAVEALPEDDRKAVLLRFFKNQSHQEIGATLGLSEDTARKRGERALEKLREHFTQRGVTVSSALLATVISAHAAEPLPAGLVANVAGASLSAAGTTPAGAALLALFMSTKTKIIVGGAVILAVMLILSIKLPGLVAPPPPAGSATKSSSSTPRPPATAAAMAGVNLPPTRIESPVVPVASVTAPAPTPAPSHPAVVELPPGPANADLKTGIPDFIHLLEAGNYLALIDYLMPPDQAAQILKEKGGHTREQLAEELRTGLENHGGAAQLLQGLYEIRDKTPVMNEAGDRAVYEVDPPIAGHNEITFIKKDGLWYGPQ